jgi:hypothetical protein
MLLALQQNLLLGDVTLVTVPDVVGETQAQGTSDLEAVGFVVSVTTAYSSVVAAGLIISQDPAGGVDYPEGGTVTITVSLGEAPAQSQAFTGGFFVAFERERERRRKRKRELEEAEEQARQLKDAVDREIAQLLQVAERKAEFEQNIVRLKRIAARFADKEAEAAMSERVRTALVRAQAQESVSAYLALQRELEHMLEEEEFAILMLLAND